MRTATRVAKGCQIAKDLNIGKNLYNSGIISSRTEETVSRMHKLAQHRGALMQSEISTPQSITADRAAILDSLR